MSEINKVILCGLGAIGSVYAEKLKVLGDNFRVLVDDVRCKKYREHPIIFNGKELDLNFILPSETGFVADLVIIATKMSGLEQVLCNLQNFIGENTLILSLINGITSEIEISEKYGWSNILYSYFIGHSAVRQENIVTQDGINTIVFGSDNKKNIQKVKEFFDSVNISYKIPADIKRSLWLKFMLNTAVNPTSALFGVTFEEMRQNNKLMQMVTAIMYEVQSIAKAYGINNPDTMVSETLEHLKTMSPDGKTSMLQDVEASRMTEIDIFAGTVLKLGAQYGIKTPYCKFIKEAFDIIHEKFNLKKMH